MQIFAFDIKGTYISALQAERKKDYLCPECQKVIRLRGGMERRAHFYHPSNTKHCRSAQKTFLHLTVQLFLADLLPANEVHLEKPFPTIKRIADCVWETQKLIFEIQCSSISQEEVKKRMHDYSSCGYTVIWIFHDSLFSSQKSSGAEYYLKKYPHYYTNINLAGKGIIYDRYEHQKLQVNLLKPSFLPLKQHFLCQFIPKGTSWLVSFAGDRMSISNKIPKKRQKILHRLLKACAFLMLER